MCADSASKWIRPRGNLTALNMVSILVDFDACVLLVSETYRETVSVANLEDPGLWIMFSHAIELRRRLFMVSLSFV
jgi:hypothetical protein